MLTLDIYMTAGITTKVQRGFWRRVCTLDHELTLVAIIEEKKSHGKRIYCRFVDSLHYRGETRMSFQLFLAYIFIDEVPDYTMR